MRPRSRAPIVLLCLLPFLVRLVYFLETRTQPYFQWNFLVAYVNHTFAADMAQGVGAPYALYRSPWYPLAVSWLYRLAGVEPLFVRLAQWLLGALGCLLIYRLGLSLFDRRVAVAALVMSALFIPAVCYEGELFEQPFAAFLLLASLNLIAAARRETGGPAHPPPRTRQVLAGLSALLFGGAVLLRPELVLALPLLLASQWLGAATRRDRVQRAGVFTVLCLLMARPLWRPDLIIDVRENHADINAAINFHLGNNPEATGHDAKFPETPELPTIDPAARRDHMTGLDLAGIRYAQARTGKGLSLVAPFWLETTLRFMAAEPLAELKLLGAKTLLFFNGHLTGTQKDLYFLRDGSWILWALLWSNAICFPMGLILPLAIVGAFTRMPAWTRLLLLSVPAGCYMATLVFFYDARFLMPAVPFMILLAGHGLVSLVRGAVRRDRAWWRGLAALAPLVILCNADWLSTHHVNRAAEEFRIGTMHLDRQETGPALAAYRRAVAADPAFIPALDNLASVAPDAGEGFATIEFLQEIGATQRATPALMRTLAALQVDVAGRLIASGDCERALTIARQVLSRDGGNARAAAAAGLCLHSLGRPLEAVAMLEPGVQHAPDDVALLGLLGQAYAALGRRQDEQRCYLRALELDPRHSLAAYQLALSLAATGRREEALARARQALSLGHPQAAALVADLESRVKPE